MKYHFTYLVSLLVLLLAGIGGSAQDIPDWFFEPDKGEFVGVSMPMTNQPNRKNLTVISGETIEAVIPITTIPVE